MKHRYNPIDFFGAFDKYTVVFELLEKYLLMHKIEKA